MTQPAPNDPRPESDSKPRLSTVLKQSDVGLLRFVGGLMDYFGVQLVVAFLVGVLATYMYSAIVGPPPYFPHGSQATAAGTSTMIRLSGVVHTMDDKPLADFNVGVVDRFVPVTNPNGAFVLEVPQRQQYNLIVGDPKVGTFYLYGSQLAQKKDATEYELTSLLSNFPLELGVVEGTAMDRDNNPIPGVVEVEGKQARIDDKGNFKLLHIPIGKTVVHIKPSDARQEPWDETIQMSVTGSTNVDVSPPK